MTLEFCIGNLQRHEKALAIYDVCQSVVELKRERPKTE